MAAKLGYLQPKCAPHWRQLGSGQTECVVLAVLGPTGIYLQVVFQLGLGATCPQRKGVHIVQGEGGSLQVVAG